MKARKSGPLRAGAETVDEIWVGERTLGVPVPGVGGEMWPWETCGRARSVAIDATGGM